MKASQGATPPSLHFINGARLKSQFPVPTTLSNIWANLAPRSSLESHIPSCFNEHLSLRPRLWLDTHNELFF